MFQLLVIKSAALCILGLLPDNIILNERERLWARLATGGCRIILRHRKSYSLRCFKEWATFERVAYRVGLILALMSGMSDYICTGTWYN